jgi:hypothetical protein
MKHKIILLVLSGILFYGCGRHFTTPVFSIKAKDHKMVAVIPFQMIYTGRVHEKLSHAEIEKITENEAIAFQQALYNRLLTQSGMKKKDIKIEFQTPERTNKILLDSGITPIYAYKETAERLAQVLGVSSIVKSRVEKQKYLTDLESFGIQLAGDILNQINIPGNLDFPIGADPNRISRTHDIRIYNELLNGTDASLLWQYHINTQTDWNYPANQLIMDVARRTSRKFPYRDRNYFKNNLNR